MSDEAHVPLKGMSISRIVFTALKITPIWMKQCVEISWTLFFKHDLSS